MIHTSAVHIHQGGTTGTYCGEQLRPGVAAVAWEQASSATCPDCLAYFPQDEFLLVLAAVKRPRTSPQAEPCCPGARRGRCKVGCPGY